MRPRPDRRRGGKSLYRGGLDGCQPAFGVPENPGWRHSRLPRGPPHALRQRHRQAVKSSAGFPECLFRPGGVSMPRFRTQAADPGEPGSWPRSSVIGGPAIRAVDGAASGDRLWPGRVGGLPPAAWTTLRVAHTAHSPDGDDPLKSIKKRFRRWASAPRALARAWPCQACRPLAPANPLPPARLGVRRPPAPACTPSLSLPQANAP